MTEQDRIEQLAALLGGEDVPGAPSSLGALADLATAVRDHADLVAPTAEFRRSLRAELVATADAPPGLLERARAAWSRRTADLRASARIAVATMTASGMIGSAGVAVAAQEALPGELLYGLKSLTEDARLTLAVDGVAEARLHLALARERLHELRSSAGQLDTDQVIALLAEMDLHSEAGAEAMLSGATTGTSDPDEVRRFTTDQRDGLVSVLNDLPLLAKSVAENSLELLRRIEVTAYAVHPTFGDCDCGEGLLDDNETSEGLDTTERRTELPLTSTTGAIVDVTVPGERPAVPLPDCDCIELAGGDEFREEPASSSDEADEQEPEGAEQEPEQAPGQEPERSGGLTGPGDDDTRDEGLADIPTSIEQLPTQDMAGTLEDTTDTDLSTDGTDTLEEAVEDTTDALLGD